MLILLGSRGAFEGICVYAHYGRRVTKVKRIFQPEIGENLCEGLIQLKIPAQVDICGGTVE